MRRIWLGLFAVAFLFTLAGAAVSSAAGPPANIDLVVSVNGVVLDPSVDSVPCDGVQSFTVTATVTDARGFPAEDGSKLIWGVSGGAANPSFGEIFGGVITTTVTPSAGAASVAVTADVGSGLLPGVDVQCIPPTATPTSTATATPTPTATSMPLPTDTPLPTAACMTFEQKISRAFGILVRFGSQQGDRRFRAVDDLNNDGRIDLGDIAMLLATPTCGLG